MALTLPALRTRLSTFSLSALTFNHLLTFGPPPSPHSPIHILDASFNPPTLAHGTLAAAALTSAHPHLLLLLATQNADKPTAPASFPHRLSMLQIFAHGLAQKHPHATIDIAITKHARFLDKAGGLRGVMRYAGKEQVWLMGFDTLVRFLDARYYPEAGGLKALDEFWRAGRVLCLWRPKEEFGGGETLEEYISEIEDGDREEEGCRKEWVHKIDVVEADAEVGTVSSTKAREAAREKDGWALRGMVGNEVARWVRKWRLYREDEVEAGDVCESPEEDDNVISKTGERPGRIWDPAFGERPT